MARMKVLVIKWNSFGDIVPTYERRGTVVYTVSVDIHAEGEKLEHQKKQVNESISEFVPNYVFSYNYHPWISEICLKHNIKYVSWVYDSPYLDLYHFSVPNPINYIFVFDYGIVEEFRNGGVNTVYYLPLAVDEFRSVVNHKKFESENEKYSKYIADVSFVGSLYSESKHRLYDKFNTVSPYAKGYLDAITTFQKHVYGYNLMEELLTDEIEEEMQKAYHTDSNTVHAMSPKKLYSQFVLSRHVTEMERKDILSILGEFGSINDMRMNLYTKDKNVSIKGWGNLGEVDYYDEMPFVFAASKINLNISLRSILTGIPLRAFDIMGMGGFLLTNYQSEFEEYFVKGEDYDYYEDYNDLVDKVDYYMTHEKERQEIARNGMEKVLHEHTLDKRIDEIEKTLSLN